MTNPRFAGKVAVITAAGAGIGLATARRFAQEGAKLAISDIDADSLEACKAALGLPEKDVLAELVDVSDFDAVSRHIDSVVERFGGLDILVNNAGLGSWGYAHELPNSRWHRVIAVTLDSVFFTAKAALPHLIARKGTIVNTASISGLFGDNGFAAYNAAKGGVVNLTRTLAIDHACDGVRVNAICPGLTETPRVGWMSQTDKIMNDYARRLPAGRAAKPEEMASVIAFLASDDASYVNGVCIPVDGGLTASAGQPMFKQLLPERPVSP